MAKFVSLWLCVLMGVVGVGASAFAGSNDAGGAGIAVLSSAGMTRGQVMCTAAINADGTVSNCYSCNKDVTKTNKIATGQYQVSFWGVCDSAQAAKGWSRWVQPDTLSMGSTKAFCTTADRAGDEKGVFVACYDQDGVAVDTAFFLFVAK